MSDFAVVSFGGCGSKFLVRAICEELGDAQFGRHHSHVREPRRLPVGGQAPVIVLFCHPVEAVASFFGRRSGTTSQHGYRREPGPANPAWARQHCQNLGGRYTELSAQWDLAAYLDHGEDLFDLADFMQRWLQCDRPGPTLFVRYEALWQHASRVGNFLGLGESFVKRLGSPRPRTSGLQCLPAQARQHAQVIYGPACTLIDGLDDVFLRRNGQPEAMPELPSD